jgi:hypothetical protein
LTRIERARGFLKAVALSENWIREMGYQVLVVEAPDTTHIEGMRATIAHEDKKAIHAKNIIDQFDHVLAKHYGFTDEELHFIINYDIKYRMGMSACDAQAGRDSGEGAE